MPVAIRVIPTVTLVGGAGNTVPVYTTNAGRFQKIDNTVFVDISLTGDGGAEGAGTGIIHIALPPDFPVGASHQAGTFLAGIAQNGSAEYALGVVMGPAGTTAIVQYFDTISNRASFIGDLQNNATRTIRLKFFYEVD